MNCDKIQNLLNDYIDETLSILHVEVVDNHCHTCDAPGISETIGISQNDRPQSGFDHSG